MKGRSTRRTGTNTAKTVIRQFADNLAGTLKSGQGAQTGQAAPKGKPEGQNG